MRGAAGTGGQPPSDPRFWEPPTPEELQSRLEGYIIEAFLARGGMGAVYRGIQTSLERPVAIKILPPQLSQHDPSFLQRFKQEARAMAQLNHPGIVKVYDFGEMSDGTLYFVMEFVEGTDVARMIAHQGRLSSAHAMAITAHVCDALQYAHGNGIIHRDIKPANIMVGSDGAVKVADFGLAKSFNSGHVSLTMTGHVMGTLNFMAPEALMLGSGVDHRADIYAVGVMLYQMLTGRVPQGLFEMPSLLVPGLDPRYDAIIAYAMRENRDHRYQSIYDMRYALDSILTQPVVQASALPQVTAPQQTAAAPARTHSPPPPRPGQPRPPQGPRSPQGPRPPQGSKAAPMVQKSSGGGIWLVAAAIVIGCGAVLWMKIDTTAKREAVPAIQFGTIGEVVFPQALFQNATIPEVFEYLQIKSRDLDPAKKGITILADEATRNSPMKISMDIKDTRLADLIAYTARLCRMEVTQVGEAVQFKPSPSAVRSFPIGKPTAKLQTISEAVFPNIRFQDASLEEACEYIRVKGKDISGQHVNLIIGPELAGRKDRITCDMVQITLADGLACIADIFDAEVAYIAESFYLQPRSTKPQQLDPWAVQSFGEAGKVIFPSLTFHNATIEEAVEFLALKSRDLDPRKRGMMILLDDSARRTAGKVTFDSKNITAANAIAQIATVAGLEIFRVRDAARLRASAKPKQSATALPAPSAAAPAPAPPVTPPAGAIKLRPSREDGEPSSIRFVNKLSEDVRIQLVGSDGRLRRSSNVKAGKTTRERTSIGQVWLITTKSGAQTGLAESLTELSTVTINPSGIETKTNQAPHHDLVSMIQFTGANIGDAVRDLRQRASDAGLNVRIELDPRVNPTAGSINLDAHTATLGEIIGMCAYQAGMSTIQDGLIFRIVPR